MAGGEGNIVCVYFAFNRVYCYIIGSCYLCNDTVYVTVSSIYFEVICNYALMILMYMKMVGLELQWQRVGNVECFELYVLRLIVPALSFSLHPPMFFCLHSVAFVRTD